MKLASMRLPLTQLPNTTQNPLLGGNQFFRTCQPRFRGINFEGGFLELLAKWERHKLLEPVYVHNDVRYYSSFQTWLMHHLVYRKTEEVIPEHRDLRGFDSLLLLLLEIQDLYLPEVRGDGRVGEFRDYGGDVAIGGTYFVTQSTYTLSELRRWRQAAIRNKEFSPHDALLKAEISVEAVKHWVDRIKHTAENLDPMEHWYPLLKYIDYSRRMKLKFDALLAQDFYEIAEVLALFLRDLGEPFGEPTLLDWTDPAYQVKGRDSEWLVDFYGRDALANPYLMLEFLSNEFGINSKPMAVVFTEGEEWVGIKKLYEFYGFPPALLGIEFRSIGGEGNFSLANWQCFIEYMHEKQVLLYYLIDKEGRAAKEAAKLISSRRKFKADYLEKVIPHDRIVTWRSSFEEDNFTDAEISRALARQGIAVTRAQVHAVRNDPGRRQGLIRAVCAPLSAKVDKRALAVDLVEILIHRRKRGLPKKRRRPVEDFVLSSGRLIGLNHQPTCEESKRHNLKSGFLG